MVMISLIPETKSCSLCLWRVSSEGAVQFDSAIKIVEYILKNQEDIKKLQTKINIHTSSKWRTQRI